MTEALLRTSDGLAWTRGALELWSAPTEVALPGAFGFAPVWFGMDFPAGRYVVEWLGGVVGFSGTSFWGLSHLSPSGGRRHGVQILTGLEEVSVPTSLVGRIDWHETPQFATEAAALAAVAGRPTLEFGHLGGPIGMALFDNPYTDNRNGTTSVRFRLHRG